MQKYITIILAVLAILALAYLFMNNDVSSTHPSQTMRNTPMHSGVENFANPTKNSGPKRTMPSNTNYDSKGKGMGMGTRTTKPQIGKRPTQPQEEEEEDFDNIETFVNTSQQQTVSGSEEIQYIAQPQSIGQTETGSQMNQLPSECYPKDVLSSVDLLPRDANSLWAQVNPSGQGSLADQNFLTSGFHIGINTVGQTLRNANRQLRSEPLNPQVKVSPWMQTTIDPDVNRRPLEISSGDL
jgi:hypothetical protein